MYFARVAPFSFSGLNIVFRDAGAAVGHGGSKRVEGNGISLNKSLPITLVSVQQQRWPQK